MDGQLRLGTTAVADRMDIVDRAAAAAGGVATLFNGDERVAATLRCPDGTRAVGTRLTNLSSGIRCCPAGGPIRAARTYSARSM